MSKKITFDDVTVCPACFALIASSYVRYHEAWHDHTLEVSRILLKQSQPHPDTHKDNPTIGK
jgi:Fe-S oxidoreductase